MAALKFLEILRRDKLVESSARLGQLFLNKLKGIAVPYDFVANVRGAGLMMGIEIADTGESPASERTDRILELAKDAGFLLGKTGPGRNVLTLMPPLIIEEQQFQEAVDALETIMQHL
jgi:4-aminobutyrate aminotransferase-like enzyme